MILFCDNDRKNDKTQIFAFISDILCRYVKTCKYPAENSKNKNELDHSFYWKKDDVALRVVCKLPKNANVCRPADRKSQIQEGVVNERIAGVAKNSIICSLFYYFSSLTTIFQGNAAIQKMKTAKRK